MATVRVAPTGATAARVAEPKLEGRERVISRQLFTKENRPQHIAETYESCKAPPAVHLLDPYDKNGACSAKYSDPEFFFREWCRPTPPLAHPHPSPNPPPRCRLLLTSDDEAVAGLVECS